MFKRALAPAIFLSFMFLTGCLSSGSGKSAPEQQSFSSLLASMENSGEIPKLDRSESLTGPDTDNNGIRDDIDRYLLTVEASEEEKLALIQAARAFQAVQVANLDDGKDLREVTSKIDRAAVCIIETYGSPVDGSRENRKLQGYTANTRNRTRHYIKFNVLLDGTVAKLPEDACDEVAQ